jgi:hypothetical protein
MTARLLIAAALTMAASAPAGAKLAPLPGSGDAPRTADDDVSWPRAPRGGPLAPVMVDDGVLFRYRAEDASHVTVVGDFNDWNEFATPLRSSRHGLWRTVVSLDEGPWPYMYVVDGVWIRDPDNPVIDVDETDADLRDASLIQIRHGEIVRPRPPGFQEGDFVFTVGYDRVNQVTLKSGLRYENRAALHPVVGIVGGRSFGRDRWLWDVSLVQPLFDAEELDVGVRVYRETASPDAHRIGDTENSLATFFFREDWRDYHEATGVQAHAMAYVVPAVRLTARWTDEDHTSVSKTTDWGLFGGEKRMRANPPVDEGRLRSLRLEYDVDTRNSIANPSRGMLVLGGYEWAGGGFGGDFEFRRATADFRRYLKLSRGHFLDFRVSGGLIQDARRGGESGPLTGFDAVPVQERFYLGGTGTMRGTQFKSLTGDRMLLANAEMRVEVFRDFQTVAFVDVGDAWIDEEADPGLKTDAGFGFQDSDASFRVNIATKVDGRREDDGSFLVSARIRRMF